MSRLQTSYAPSMSVSRRQQPLWQSALAWSLLTVPVLVFGLVWQHYAVNVPKWDDHALREFLFRFDQETGVSGKLYWLFKQHNEHRIVYDRIVALLDYWLFGKLSYKHLMMVGNLSLVGLLAIFIAVLRRANPASADRLHRGRPEWMGWSVLYAVPVALLLFNLSQWENMFWGMAALQNFSVVLWVLLAFYFLNYTHQWGLAFVMAVLASLTSGNGLMVWPIGLALLILRGTESRRSAHSPAWRSSAFQSLAGWLLGAVIVIGLYFTGFEQPGGTHAVRPGALALLKGWLAVAGAAAEALPASSSLRNSVLLGSLILGATFGLLGWGMLLYGRAIGRVVRVWWNPINSASVGRASLPPVLLFFGSSVAFLLGTAAVVAWTRTGFGANLLITSRYKIYSLTLLALLYVYAVNALSGRAKRWVGVSGGVASLALAWLSYYSFLDETIWWRHWLLTKQFNWTYTTSRPVAQLDAITRRYTDPAPAFYDAALPTLFGPSQPPAVALSMTKTPTGYAIRNTSLPVLGLRDEGTYVVARSPKRTYLIQTRQNQTSPRRARLWPTRQFSTGFTAEVFSAELEAGTYPLFILTVPSAGQPTLHPTGQTITSAGQPIAPTPKNW